MNSPVAYFTVYILGVQLVSAAISNGFADSVTNTQQPNSSETGALSSAPPATGSSLTSAQSALLNGTHDGSNLTTTTEGGDGNTTVETSSPNDGIRKPATSQPKGEDTPAVTTEGKATATAKSSSTTVAKTAKPTPAHQGGSGYVLLVLLILVIICFLVVIYFLHKKSKRYSFDLHHKVGEEASIPLNTVDQEGSFQPTGAKEDDLAQPVEEENIPNSITVGLTPNGPSSEPEPGSDHDEGSLEKAPSEESFGSQAPLSPKDEPFTLDLNDLNLNPSTHTSVESLGEPNNENNNAGSGDTPGQDSAQADLNQDVAETHLDETA
ncbi:uncharacterized protein LOC118232288 isoform X2 [Anguilla anguilla]|uniref:uncharacterized protein LOC118232288 isoform X2 n=1 Tax=Anguilla anguilla TaxID=7936 RepID=UPI0015B0C30E|nr:uncharacterized protein LOC118232288 isoform X2 [Anguilla anguilla]